MLRRFQSSSGKTRHDLRSPARIDFFDDPTVFINWPASIGVR